MSLIPHSNSFHSFELGLLVLGFLLLFVSSSRSSADPAPSRPSSGDSLHAADRPSAPRRRPNNTLPNRLRFQIEAARSVAQRHLQRSATCRALFAPFDRDGLALLVRAEIVAAEKTPHAHVCENDLSTLVTEIGGRTIGVCRDSFERLDRYEAAARLLHEILHHAGMSERPHDPEGLWPNEITRVVKRACGL